MNIKTKFNVGDKIWTIYETEPIEKCPLCNGAEMVKIKNKNYICPECKGNGYITKKYFEWVVFVYAKEIIKIIINHDKKLIYSVGHNEYDAKDCFLTKAEAQTECDRRNNDKRGN